MEKINNMYEYFEEYSKEQIDSALSKLSEKDLKIIRIKYGLNPKINILTEKQENYFYEYIIPKLICLMEKGKIKNKNQLITKLIKKTREKYKDYSNYLDDMFYENLKTKILDFYDYESFINPEIYLMVIIDNFVLKEFSKYIKNDEIDLEIMLIDKYLKYVTTILRKKGFTEEYIVKNAENILMEIVENYNNDENFYIYMGKCIKNRITSKEKILKK